MRIPIAAALVTLLTLSAGRALAQPCVPQCTYTQPSPYRSYSCCDLTSADGACVSQNGRCNLSGWSLELSLFWAVQRADGWEVAGNAPPWLSCADGPVPPGGNCTKVWKWVPGFLPNQLNGSFPAGTVGYADWVAKPDPAWVGFCLVAPSPSDPMHASPAEPIGCVRPSVLPGVYAEMARFHLPANPTGWDAYQFCYGAQLAEGQPGSPCQNINDDVDTTVSPTPTTGSCCGPAQLFRADDQSGGDWEVDVNQEIPGVPPPDLLYAADGGLLPYEQTPGLADTPTTSGDHTGTDPDQCLGAYNEPTNCGSAPNGNNPPEPPGGGGKGGCALSPGASPASAAGPVAALALVMMRRRRRAK